MRIPALVMVMILAATPALPQSATPTPQSPPPPEASDGAQPNDTAFVEVSDNLQRAFDLMKQPGFHPELLELLAIEVAQETEAEEEPESGGLKTWHWILIGVGIFVVLVALSMPCGFQKGC